MRHTGFRNPGHHNVSVIIFRCGASFTVRKPKRNTARSRRPIAMPSTTRSGSSKHLDQCSPIRIKVRSEARDRSASFDRAADGAECGRSLNVLRTRSSSRPSVLRRKWIRDALTGPFGRQQAG